MLKLKQTALIEFIWWVYTNVIMSDLPREKPPQRKSGKVSELYEKATLKSIGCQVTTKFDVQSGGKYDLIGSFHFKDPFVICTTGMISMGPICGARCCGSVHSKMTKSGPKTNTFSFHWRLYPNSHCQFFFNIPGHF